MAATVVTLRWLGGLRAEAQSEDGIPVQVSAVRNYGEGTALSPMELVLVALASCSALATISILTRLTQGLQGCTVEATGTTHDGYPKVFTDITIRYTFVGSGLRPELIEKSLALMEEKYCPVSAMLRQAVPIHHTWTIEETAPSVA